MNSNIRTRSNALSQTLLKVTLKEDQNFSEVSSQESTDECNNSPIASKVRNLNNRLFDGKNNIPFGCITPIPLHKTNSSNSSLNTPSVLETEDEVDLLNCGKYGKIVPDDNSHNNFCNFEIFKIGQKQQLLGSGAFADVFLGINKINNKKYAIKVLDKEKMTSNNIKPSFIKKEMDIHSQISHPYIISLRCLKETSCNFQIVMDLAKNGTLYSKLKKMNNGFSEETAFKYFTQTCSAIYFLHKNGLCHRDIKPENLLLDENNNIKLCDFSWCNKIDRKKPFNDFCGTYEYMAPEIIRKDFYDEKVDVWALGVLLFELLHGKSPYAPQNLNLSDKSSAQLLYNNILQNNFKIKDSVSTHAYNLIKALLKSNPKDRPSVHEIFDFPWMSNQTNFSRTYKKKNTVYLKPHSFNTPVVGISNSNVRVPNIEDKNPFNKTLSTSNNLISIFNIMEPLDQPMSIPTHKYKNSSNNLSSLISLNEPNKQSPILSKEKEVRSINFGGTLEDNDAFNPMKKQSSKVVLNLIIDNEVNPKCENSEYKELSYFKEIDEDHKVQSIKKKNSLVIRGSISKGILPEQSTEQHGLVKPSNRISYDMKAVLSQKKSSHNLLPVTPKFLQD